MLNLSVTNRLQHALLVYISTVLGTNSLKSVDVSLSNKKQTNKQTNKADLVNNLGHSLDRC